MRLIYRVFTGVSRMSYTTNSSNNWKDLDKTSFSFSINNFPDAKKSKKTGEKIESEIFSIMATKFIIGVYPSGEWRGRWVCVCLPLQCQWPHCAGRFNHHCWKPGAQREIKWDSIKEIGGVSSLRPGKSARTWKSLWMRLKWKKRSSMELLVIWVWPAGS